MRTLRVSEDLQECKFLWNLLVPQERLFDLWEARACFQKQFSSRLHFLVVEEMGRPIGLVPLSWMDNLSRFGYFPGETWEGKTWIEQNRIVAPDDYVLEMLLDNLPRPIHLRYLTKDSLPSSDIFLDHDEIGYLFYPSDHGYSFPKYLNCFSGKTRKKIERELTHLRSFGVRYRYDYPPDVEALFNLNIMKYGPDSYFSDSRFYEAFERLTNWLREKEMLRITSVFLGDKLAAVDIGALFNGSYTLLAGGVHIEFPGVAKLINFHHLEYACHERLREVDFLCGDFGWKERFHLSSRPLYEIQLREENQIIFQEEIAKVYEHA